MTMNTSSQIAHEEFIQAIEPFLEMLVEKEKVLSNDEWVSLVNSTKERIIEAPEQYLVGISKSSGDLRTTIETIFRERLN